MLSFLEHWLTGISYFLHLGNVHLVQFQHPTSPFEHAMEDATFSPTYIFPFLATLLKLLLDGYNVAFSCLTIFLRDIILSV